MHNASSLCVVYTNRAATGRMRGRMERRVGQSIAGLTIVLLLVACGGSGSSGNAGKTATAQTSAINDAATVTAFAGGRTSGAGRPPPAQRLARPPASGTRVAGKSGGFAFATLSPGGAAGSGQAAAGTPRGTVTNAGATGATPSASRRGQRERWQRRDTGRTRRQQVHRSAGSLLADDPAGMAYPGCERRDRRLPGDAEHTAGDLPACCRGCRHGHIGR